MKHTSGAWLAAAIFCLISVSRCEGTSKNKEDPEVKIYKHRTEEKFGVNITFSDAQKNSFKFSQLRCSQSNNEAMEGAVKLNVKQIDSVQLNISGSYIYELELKTAGFVRCTYKGVYKTVFVRVGLTHFSAVKFNQEANITILKNAVKGQMFTVKQISTDPRVYHFEINSTKLLKYNQTADIIITTKLEKLLKQKLQAPLVVEYVRSTRFCPRSDDYNIPFGKSSESVSIDKKFTLKCEGDYYTGAFWNEIQLQKLIAFYDTFPTVNPNFINFNEIKNLSDQLETILALDAVRHLPTIANNFEEIVKNGTENWGNEKDKPRISNKLLESLDSALLKTVLPIPPGFVEQVRPNFAVRVENLKNTKNAGIYVMDNNTDELLNLADFTTEKNNDQIVTTSPRVGMRLPNYLLNTKDKKPQILVVEVFSDAKSLFNSKYPTSTVISAKLNGAQVANLEEPIVLWFRREKGASEKKGTCVYWNLKAADGKGSWSTKGCKMSTSHRLNDSTYIDECQCDHMTHFSLIFWNSDTAFFPEDGDFYQHQNTLELVSQIGSIVSLVGLAGVFLTAALQKEWRSGPGQKILLQMSINLALLQIILLLANNIETSVKGCFVIGFFTHYAMLSNFMWMAVAGFLQYYRLVRVIYTRTPQMNLKAALVGWGVPLVPGLLVLISGKFNVYSGFPLCLPSGWAFYTTTLAPLCVVLVFNVAVFIKIIMNLYIAFEPKRHVDRCLSIRRFKQLAFLFHLLGLSWFFGVCQAAFPSARIFFAYMMGLTVAFQGFAYFLFFVLMHDKTRDSWKALLCSGKTLFKFGENSTGRDRESTNTESVNLSQNK